MLPRFKSVSDWDRAQLVMQPCLIRVIDNLRKQIESSNYQATYQEVTEPIAGHQLHLSYQGKDILVLDLWQICFKICFVEYPCMQEVEIDRQLFDEQGELSWESLENKTSRLISQIFSDLPATS